MNFFSLLREKRRSIAGKLSASSLEVELLTFVAQKTIFFLIHVLLYILFYLIPRIVCVFFRFLLRVITLYFFRTSNPYISRPEAEIRLIHNSKHLEVVEDVFGLMDVKESSREDRQFCCTTKEEERKIRSDAAKKGLIYDAPFYNAHLSTIFAVKRPTRKLNYTREEILSWDGCPMAVDWYCVKGSNPLRPGNAYRHFGQQEAQGSQKSSCSQGSFRINTEEKDCKNTSEASSLFSKPSASLPFMESDGVLSPGTSLLTSAGGESHEFASAESPHSSTSPEAISPPFSRPCFPCESSSLPSKDSIFFSTSVKGVVVILPGLTSDHQTGYIRRAVQCFHSHNFHVCVINTRGFGGVSANAPFMLNSAYTKDFWWVVHTMLTKNAIRHRFGAILPVFAVGMSNGGGILSKYLGEAGRDGKEVHLDAAITCCAPNDVVNLVEHMNRGTMQQLIYQPNMCSDVRSYVLKHPAFQNLPNVDKDYVFTKGNIHRFTRIVHFDEHIFCKTSGYRSLHHYHLDASAVHWLVYTPIPTLVLSTFDDPVIGRSVMPHRWKEICENNPRLVYAESTVGGHLGFLGGPLEELRGRPDFMLRFIVKRLDAASAYWHKIHGDPRKSTGLMAITALPSKGCIGENSKNFLSAKEFSLSPCGLSDSDARQEEEEPIGGLSPSPTLQCLVSHEIVPRAFQSPPAPLPLVVNTLTAEVKRESSVFPINSPYFSEKTKKPIPKEGLYAPYFQVLHSSVSEANIPYVPRQNVSSPLPPNEESELMGRKLKWDDKEEIYYKRPCSLKELLPLSRSHKPVKTNCDYCVDTRLYLYPPVPGVV